MNWAEWTNNHWLVAVGIPVLVLLFRFFSVWEKILVLIDRYREPINEHDIALFKKYKAIFVDNGVAETYRQHDFLGTFAEADWRPLSRFVDTWGAVEYEFVDKKLNSDLKRVYVSGKDLAEKIARCTVPIGSEGSLRSVKPDGLPGGSIPEDIREQARLINDAVPPFVTAHKKFVRRANRKLSRGSK